MKIAIAIDGSSASINALEQTLKFARGWGGEHQLALVNVQQPVVHADAFGITAGMDGPLLQQIGQRDLAPALAIAEASGFAVEHSIEVGPAAGCIAEYARKVGADLIVLGTKGRSNIANVLVGSVAHRIPQQSNLPVMLVPPKNGG